MIPITKPFIGDQELMAIKKVFRSNWLGMGTFVYDFEKKIADFIGAKEVIATSSGTAAIHLALDVLDLKPGDEVLVPSLTYIAAIQAILQVGAKPVFCDVEEESLNISIKDVKKKISQHTKVILPLHFRGVSCDMNSLLEISENKNLTIVEDAAHAFGSKFINRNSNIVKLGSVGDFTCFSFDPIKVITCGEGGAICTNNIELADKIRKKRMLGVSKDSWSRLKNNEGWFYDVIEKGYRYHMSNISAAIGLTQLEKINDFIKRRARIARYYDEAFSDIFFKDKIKILPVNYNNSVIFTYIMRILNSKRNQMIEFLNANDIGSGVHYIPCHLHSLCRPYSAENLYVTEEIANQIITLPLYCELKEFELDKIIKTIKSFYK